MVTEPVINGKAFGVPVSLREGDEPPSRRERRVAQSVKDTKVDWSCAGNGARAHRSRLTANITAKWSAALHEQSFFAISATRRLVRLDRNAAAEGSDGPRRNA
jgi:hypothetical protein